MGLLGYFSLTIRRNETVKALIREARVLAWSMTAVAACMLPAPLAAQTRTVAPPEGVPRLMVAPFRGSEKGLGSQASEAVLNKITDDVQIKQLFVIPRKYVCQNLEASGFTCDSALDPITAKQLATALRADEYLEGTVTRSGANYSLATSMVLTRDNSMVQPLPVVQGPKLKDLAEQVSKEIQAARKQLPDERKCELAVAGGHPQDGVTAARAAIAAYPQSTIGRVCLANAYLALKMPPDSIINVTSKAIEIDPANRPALALAAQAYKDRFDKTKDTTSLDKAVDTWTAMLRADPKNATLVQTVSEKIAASGRAARAKPIILQALQDNPGDPSLMHLAWLILQATKDYQQAADMGEQMIKSDTAAADTSFFARQAALYTLANQPQKAAETSARGVAKFKDNATLWSLNSQTQRLAGQMQKAVESADMAIKLNPKAEHAYLRKANAQIELNQADSAMLSLRGALANGEDSSTVAQFLLSVGNKAFKAANDSTHPGTIQDFQHAVQILSFADSVAPSPAAKFLIGVSSLKIGDQAVRQNQTAKKCDLAKTAQDAFVAAQINLQQGGTIDPKTAAQLLAAIPQYTPAVDAQVKKYCK